MPKILGFYILNNTPKTRLWRDLFKIFYFTAKVHIFLLLRINIEVDGAFSYSRSDVHNVLQYIQNQELHHKTVTFEAEYRKLLDEFNIEYYGRYILKSVN